MGEVRQVFVTGGTGYLGGALLPALLARGHRVRALARPGSAAKLPPGCAAVPGNALDAATFDAQVAPASARPSCAPGTCSAPATAGRTP